MANSLTCIGLEKYQVQYRTQAHSWVGDLPSVLGGDGLGPNPMDLLLSAVGGCLCSSVYKYAAGAEIPVEKIRANLNGQWDEPDKKAYSIEIKLLVSGDLNDKQMKGIEKAAGRCPVKGIVGEGAQIDLKVLKV